MSRKLAKARDRWILSEDGQKCCSGKTQGIFLKDRLEEAFRDGWNAHEILHEKPCKTCGGRTWINANYSTIGGMKPCGTISCPDCQSKAKLTCQTCGGSGQVPEDYDYEFGGVCGAASEILGLTKPCPDCQPKEPKPSDAAEFVSNVRKALVVMTEEGKFHRNIMEEAIKIIEQLEADKAEQAKQIAELQARKGVTDGKERIH